MLLVNRKCQSSNPVYTGFVTRLTRRVPLVEQELHPYGTPEFNPGFQWGSCYSIFSFICMFCRLLFVLLYFLFWPLCCLFFFNLQILITSLVSSNYSFISCNTSNLHFTLYICIYRINTFYILHYSFIYKYATHLLGSS